LTHWDSAEGEENIKAKDVAAREPSALPASLEGTANLAEDWFGRKETLFFEVASWPAKEGVSYRGSDRGDPVVPVLSSVLR